MRAEISESAKASEDSCEESVPRLRTKPPRPRKKSKDPLFEEDVVEGFAFLAFKNYEDLEVSSEGLAGRQAGRAAGPGRPTQGRPGRGGAGRAVLRGTWCWEQWWRAARHPPPSTPAAQGWNPRGRRLPAQHCRTCCRSTPTCTLQPAARSGCARPGRWQGAAPPPLPLLLVRGAARESDN